MSRIAVLGDAMTDVYVEGTVDRVCPEAPVPVLLKGKTWERPGGAANVVANLEALGHAVTLYTSPRIIRKIRYLDVSGHLMLRVDEEADETDFGFEWVARLRAEISDCEALVVSDYHKGTVLPCAEYFTWPRIAVVDAKRDWWRFESTNAVLKGNAMSGVPPVLGAVRTMGKHGAQWFDGQQWHHIPAPEVQVTDVTGAGDTVTAWLAHGLLEGRALPEALERAVRAGSLACQVRGTAVIASLS